MVKWECYVCWKVNEVEEAAADGSCVCCCCGRPRNFVPISVMVTSQAKPLVLHGLAAAQHEFHPALVNALQQAGLDLAETDSAGWTALHCAVMLGDAVAVHCLLAPNANETKDSTKQRVEILEAARPGGWRALHLAVRGGHRAVVEELLLANADVDAKLDASEDALTPLHLAVRQGHADIVDLLLQCGADATQLTRHLGRTSLHIAVANGHERCVRLLLSQPELIDIRDGDGLTALQLANILPGLSGRKTAVQHEIIVLLEAHQQFGSAQSTPMQSLFG